MRVPSVLAAVCVAFHAFAPAIALADGKAVVATLPSTPHRGMPRVNIMLNGKGPYAFAIDTGAPGRVIIDPKVVAELGLQKVGEEMMSDGSENNQYPTPIYGIDSLTFGTKTFSSLTGVVVDMGRWGSTVSGMFGMEVFKDHVLVLDYAADQVSIEEGPLPPADGVSRFDVVIRPDGMIELPLTVAGQAVNAVLDTGNTIKSGFSAPDGLAAKLRRDEGVVSGTARTVTNNITLRTAELAGPVTLGPNTLPVTNVNYPTPGGYEAILGSAALRGARLKVDQTSRRIEITWPSAKPAN